MVYRITIQLLGIDQSLTDTATVTKAALLYTIAPFVLVGLFVGTKTGALMKDMTV